MTGRKATVRDVAREAGVSLATVDRVLNGRAGVRAVTVERVSAAVEKLGYTKDMGAALLARDRFYRLLFLLPEGRNAFMETLERKIRQAALGAEGARTQVEIRAIPLLDGHTLVETLDAVDPGAWDGVALVATDAPRVRDAIDRLAARGVAVVTLVSDLPGSNRARFIGIDNIAAGRTAATLLGRFIGARAGRVQLLVGSLLLRDHVERRLGFEQVLSSDFPHLTLAPPIEALEDNNLSKALMDARLRQDPSVVGIYSIGGGNRGMIAALKENGRAGAIRVVAHEVTSFTRSALLDGTLDALIQQDPGHEARSAIRVLKSLIGGEALDPEQERIRIEIFLRDNLP